MSAETKKIKVLMSKISLDGHWRGLSLVATTLRDAGMEVVWGGLMTADQIVEAAIQEDVGVIGLNVGSRYGVIRDLMKILREREIDDMLVVVGGTIPPGDIPALKEMGVDGVFPPGSDLDSIARIIKEKVRDRSSN